tara:strand:+ start:1796 stop:2269 length:474 start_codon:yes stop_codon:yes gene_type:complete
MKIPKGLSLKTNKYKPYEFILGVMLSLIIVMSMNKSIPDNIKELLTSVPGIMILCVVIFVLFSNGNKVVGILAIILLYILSQSTQTPSYIIPNSNTIIDRIKPVGHVSKVSDYQNVNKNESLEEEVVRTMIPIANENNISQPRYASKLSSDEIYTSI